MRVRTMLLFVGLLMAVGLIAAGCGGDDSTTATTAEETSATTAEETSDSAAGGISEADQAGIVDGCRSTIDASPEIDAETGDALIEACEDAAASSADLDEASQSICVATAKAVGGDAITDEQAETGCEAQAP